MGGESKMSLTADMLRGHTETIILARLQIKDSYGYEINKVIQTLTGNLYELKEATLYGAFRRLEEAGYIVSYWGDERTGARRKYYTITDSGARALERSIEEWQDTKNMIDNLILKNEN